MEVRNEIRMLKSKVKAIFQELEISGIVSKERLESVTDYFLQKEQNEKPVRRTPTFDRNRVKKCLLNIGQISQLFGMSKYWIRVRLHEIPHIREGKKSIRFDQDAVELWFKNYCQQEEVKK